MEKSKIGGLLGICRKAGKMVIGTDLTADAVRSGNKVCLVLFADDASPNTVKRITNCCAYYETACEKIPFTSEEIGHLTGKTGNVAAVGIQDEGFGKAILKTMKG